MQDEEEEIDTQGFLMTQRQELRENRLASYNRLNVRGDLESLKTEITPFIEKKVKLFTLRDFLPSRHALCRQVIEHYQLRHNTAYTINHNLVFNATIDSSTSLRSSSNSPSVNERNGIGIHNLITGKMTVLVDLYQQGNAHLKLCSISALDDLVVSGSVKGDLIIKRLYSEADDTHFKTLSRDENGITNFLKLFETNSGSIRSLCCNNDGFVRIFDHQTESVISSTKFPWAPNCAAISNDKKLAVIVGDCTDPHIVNIETGKTLVSIPGHLDHSFACDWSPNGQYLATGSQDETVRIYDSRNFTRALAVLPATMSAFRSIAFSPTSRYLLMAESADFVHVVETAQPTFSLEMDFFGEIGGTCWNFKGDCFYIGAAETRVGGFFEYELFDDANSIIDG